MRKGVILSLVVATFATGLQAEGDILPVSLENEIVEVAVEPIVVPPIVEPKIVPIVPKVGHSVTESGLAYGGGLEYELSHNTALVTEYETSNIDSTRGDAISLGLMYNF